MSTAVIVTIVGLEAAIALLMLWAVCELISIRGSGNDTERIVDQLGIIIRQNSVMTAYVMPPLRATSEPSAPAPQAEVAKVQPTYRSRKKA